MGFARTIGRQVCQTAVRKSAEFRNDRVNCLIKELLDMLVVSKTVLIPVIEDTLSFVEWVVARMIAAWILSWITTCRLDTHLVQVLRRQIQFQIYSSSAWYRSSRLTVSSLLVVIRSKWGAKQVQGFSRKRFLIAWPLWLVYMDRLLSDLLVCGSCNVVAVGVDRSVVGIHNALDLILDAC